MGLLGVALLALPSTALAEPPQVERFGLFEGELLLRAGQPPPPNPFATLCNVSVIYVGSERSRHPQMTVGAYFASAGDSARGGSAPPAWRFRFSPDAVGEWQWSSSCGPEIAAAAGSVRCVAGNAVGGLVANGKDFAHEDGSPHFLIGIELDWLWALELDAAAGVKTAPLEGFIRHITSFGFNHALVNTFANWSNWNAADPVDGGFPPRTMPRVSPTLLTPWDPDTPDQSRLSLPFFEHWDRVIRTMGRYNLTAHMMLYVGNKQVQWPPRGSAADDIYWRYVLHRYGAFSNIVLDVSKEAGAYGVGVPYAQDRLRLIHELNPHKRLVTAQGPGVFPPPGFCPTPGGCDMLSLQHHFSDWSATSHSFYDWVIKTRDANPTVPMVVAEFLYEAGPDRGCAGSCCGGCHQGCGPHEDNHGYQCPANATDSAAKRMIMWDIYMAGGYGTWYNCDTAWDVITMSTSPGYHAVKTLANFWADVDRTKMAPHDELLSVAPGTAGHCLADPGKEYIVHLHGLSLQDSRSRGFELRLSGVAAGGGVSGYWVDTTSGARTEVVGQSGGKAIVDGENRLEAPAGESDSYVLRLRVAG